MTSSIKVKFFSMKNITGSIFGKFEVISPKRILLNDTIICLAKLGEYSKNLKDGMFVGVEQTRKDSLFVGKNKTKVFPNGHNGYFDMASVLFADEHIRKILNVDGGWDGEWGNDDVLDKLTDAEIQRRIDEYRNDPWIKNLPLMDKFWSGINNIDHFIEKCKKRNIPEEIYKYYIESTSIYTCSDCNQETTCACPLYDERTDKTIRYVCLDCSTKYRQFVVHHLDEKTHKRQLGGLVKSSTTLKKYDRELIDIDSDLTWKQSLKH